MANLMNRKCKPCEGGVDPLQGAEVERLLKQVPGWALEGSAIVKSYTFKNHYETMAFANAVAWISHREDHHPDMNVGYNACRIAYMTHAINGLSENDFICAAKVDALFDL